MPKIKIIDHITARHIWWYCPGCQMKHHVPVGDPDGQDVLWGFNENVDKPTLTPSVGREGNTGSPKCHSDITDGFIHFHRDCDHPLTGHVVEMVDMTS